MSDLGRRGDEKIWDRQAMSTALGELALYIHRSIEDPFSDRYLGVGERPAMSGLAVLVEAPHAVEDFEVDDRAGWHSPRREAPLL